MRALAVVVIAIAMSAAIAHEDHEHPPKGEAKPEQTEKQQLERINVLYLSTVKSIFTKSCFDCHSQQTRYPWYYKLPGAKRLIDRDVKEAKVHLDFTQDFPFEGHGTPKEDLEAIRKSIGKGSMPPFRYKILHWGSGLTVAEVKLVNDWVDASLAILSQ